MPPLELRAPSAMRAPWLGAARGSPGAAARAFDSTLATRLDEARATRERDYRHLDLYGRVRNTSEFEPPGADRSLLGVSRKYADLTIDGQARLEIRTERLRNERCNAFQLLDPNSGCRGGFKAPRIDNEFNIRAGGLIGQRLHVDVNYDTQRDFAANQDIRVYYQGLEDEVVRRVEVGTVNFRPPSSRFITASIPTSNFGVNADFEVGSFQFQTLAATQKGSVVGERTYTIGQTTSQPQDRAVRDLDFESGRFFWVVDPALLPGYPAVDILNLDPGQLTLSERPQQIRVYRHRISGRTGESTNLGGIDAIANRRDASGQQFGGSRTFWELLIEGTDYYLDPTGLWCVLNGKLDQNDYLAVSFTTAAGGRVGTFPANDTPNVTDTLELIVAPKAGPLQATFRYEMRQVYRVAGSDLDPTSLKVGLSLNRSERPVSGAASTYLGLLGLAVPTDPGILDRDNRVFPRTRDAGASQVVRESYLVFPNAQPFADPGRLTPGERSDSLYRAPLYLVQSPEGPPGKFEFRFRYNSTGAGDRSSLNLNALQIRDGSEKLLAGGRELERGVDYTIAYETGIVTFSNPDALFGTGAVQVTARFEERGVFAVAPTSIFGLATRYRLGEVGGINLIGLYQAEQSAYNRPQLGFEASANLIGGINTDLQFRTTSLTRFFNAITGRRSTAPSQIAVNGELAFTKPDPNRSGTAYLEEFESDASIQVSLRENVWEFGSRPQRPDGVDDLFPIGFDSADAVQLTWQNLVPTAENRVFEVRPQDIDPNIRIVGGTAGQQQLETALFLTLHADTAGGLVDVNNRSHWSQPARPPHSRWRSMVTALSTTGTDFSRNEFLEFWVFRPAAGKTGITQPADQAGARLVIDLGSVNEDALAVAPDSIRVNGTDTTYVGRQYIGVGRLDTERRATGVFNAQTDDIGILADRPDQLIDPTGVPIVDFPLCQRQLAAVVPLFPWGDLGSRCTAGNGTLDTEDLDGDNALNATGSNDNAFRYVVDLRSSKYFVRDGGVDPQTGGKWQLYRVAIRQPDAVIGTPNLRQVQHLRLTLVAPPGDGINNLAAQFALGRMRFVGSPWARRADQPILGLSGATAEPHGEVVTSVISTENKSDTDLGYSSPPGVQDALVRRDNIRDQLATQVNEKSLRIIARDLKLGERAEAYLRFPAGPQNVLSYRQLRVWARGRGAGWDERDFEAFVKLGSDNSNFYLYRAPAHTTSWEPEMVIDLEVWRRLRADIESRWLAGQAPSGAAQCAGTDTLAFVACDGAYIVQVRDPGVSPPNLAKVQEISAGIFRVGQGSAAGDAELWVDDIRLGSPLSETGTALAFDTRIVGSDVADLALSFVRQDGQFRQLNQDPSYRTTSTFSLASTWRLDRFLPSKFGLAMPFTVNYARTGVDPQLISGSDIRGADLQNLRRPDGWSTTYAFAVRREARGVGWFARSFLDPLALTATMTRGRTTSELRSVRAQNYAAGGTYNLSMSRRGFRFSLKGLVDKLPRWLREGEGLKSLRTGQVSLVPTSIRLGSNLTRDEANDLSFLVPVVRPTDGSLLPALSLQHLWRNNAGMTWQPLGMLTMGADLVSTRDLRVYPDSSTIGRVAYQERRFFLGMPVGVERDRAFSTSFSLAPRLSSWLRPRYVRTSSFILSRSLNTRAPVRLDADTLGPFILPQTLNNLRSRELGLSLDYGRALRQLMGDSSGVGRAFRRVRPIEISDRASLGSTYDLATFDPNLGFMLGSGTLDQFLSRDGERARGVVRLHTTSISTGAELPFGLSVTTTFGLTRTENYRDVGGQPVQTIARQIEWPVGSVRWTQPFRGGPISLLALGSTVRVREGVTIQPSASGAAVQSATRSTTLNPDFQLSLRNGMTITASYSALTQRTENNGTLTRLAQRDLLGSFVYSFRMPAALGKTRRTVRSNLTAVSSTTTTCLLRAGAGDCTAISDSYRRELRGGLDTDLAKNVSGGLQLGYTLNEAKQLDRRTSQFFLSANFQLSLFAGDYR